MVQAAGGHLSVRPGERMRSWKGLSCGLRLSGAVALTESNIGTARRPGEMPLFPPNSLAFGITHHSEWAVAFPSATTDEAKGF